VLSPRLTAARTTPSYPEQSMTTSDLTPARTTSVLSPPPPWDLLPDAEPDLRGQTVVVLHAHPDDEAIFTGATIRRLANAGARIVLLVATSGERGDIRTVLSQGETLARRRMLELVRSCRLLGVQRLVPLGFEDSGLDRTGDVTGPAATTFARADVELTARLVAGICLTENADALIHYDSNGIYDHPDHVAVHRVGARAAELARVTAYQATVDRDYLGLTDRHLVEGSGPLWTRPTVGRRTTEITTAVAADVLTLATKRQAMLTHASQIRPADISTARSDEVYGLEWFLRVGPPGILERLGNHHPA
jgi:LmbE family N-acetylglucosaminyl deacetylase